MATVLVVDDDDNARLLVRTLLAHAGHIVYEAPNGADGLAVAATERPDLLILDLSMPSMGGPQFVRALRADPATAALRVALYTATPMNDALRDFMAMYRIRHIIPKPSEPEELLKAVRLALSA